MFKTKKFWYISLFAILYLIVAFSSFYHAVAFFGLANNPWMSIILAFAFEIGQAAVLFSLLTSKKDRSRIMPWVLMVMFTLVQVIGNVYSSYKYIITNSVENLRYFKEPIFIWTDIPDDQATVIIVYLVGALLPIASLLLTSMITNYLTDEEEQKELENKKEELPINILGEHSILQKENESLKEEIEKLKKVNEEQSNNDNGEQQLETISNQTRTESDNEETKEKISETTNNDKIIYNSVDEALSHEHENETGIEGIEKKLKEETSKNDEENLKMADVLMGGNILNKKENERKSHFIN